MGIPADSILDKEHHAAIIRNMDMILRVANIPPKYLHNSMLKGKSKDAEIDWVKHFKKYRKDNMPGLAMVGTENALEKQMEMCGALLRNFIDGRVMNLNRVLEHLEDGDMPSPSALFIPNFYVTLGTGKPLPAFKTQKLYDLLMSRFIGNKPTCLFIEDMEGMRAAYGDAMADLIRGSYLVAEE